MKKDNMKKESPFEQAGGQSKETVKRQSMDPKVLSEMMNPSNMNYFGAVFSFTDL